MDTINEDAPTWVDLKEVEKDLDEAYIGYATATSAYNRMIYACAIENFHKALVTIYAQIKNQKGNYEAMKCGMCCEYETEI